MPTRSYRALKASAKKRRARRTAWGSTLPAPDTIALRKMRVRSRNEQRKAERFAYSYHSQERVLFVQSIPCVIDGTVPSVNAHVGAKAGAGLKGPYTQIVPLSPRRHKELHDKGVIRRGDETFTKAGLLVAASVVEKAWQTRKRVEAWRSLDAWRAGGGGAE